MASLESGLQQRAGFATHGVGESPPGGIGVPRFYKQVSIQKVEGEQVRLARMLEHYSAVVGEGQT